MFYTTQKMKSVFSIYDYRQTVDSIFSSVSLHTSNLGDPFYLNQYMTLT
jgi:hypothetical protein